MRSFWKYFLSFVFVSANVLAQTQADFPTNEETLRVDSEGFSPRMHARLLGTHPTGAIGLFHTVSAQLQPASPTSFGLFLSGNYYSKLKFPAPTFISERFDSNFGISYTPSSMFEVFLSAGFLTTNNEPPTNPLYRQKGNLGLGGKFSYPFTASLTGGLMYWGEKRNSVSAIPSSTYALNHELIGLATFDSGGSFRHHANIGYRIDNNKRVVAGLTTDQRQLTILKVYGNNLVKLAMGTEYLMKWASLSAEYSIDYIMSSKAGFSGQPQRLTLSSRLFPSSNRALGLQLGVDLGLISSTTLTTVMKEPPMSYWFGLNYLFGMQKSKFSEPSTAFEDVAFPKESKNNKLSISSEQSRISGYITNIETGDPIENVKVYLCDDQSNPIVTDSSGRYRSVPLKTGSCEIRMQHPDYKTSTETVQVAGDAEQSFDFGLLQESKEKGALMIRVKDIEGNPTASTISFPENPELESLETNEFGQIKIPMSPGRYVVRAKAPKMKAQTKKGELNSKQDLFVDFALVPDGLSIPTEPTALEPDKLTEIKISKDKKSIEIPERVQFEIDKAQLTKGSTKLLDEVVKFLKKHTEIKKVQIGGHTDNSGKQEVNLKLSQQRADAVKAYFVKKGISEKRLESKGFGQGKPVFDNDTDEGKIKNRRVEFKIKDQATTKSTVKKKK